MFARVMVCSFPRWFACLIACLFVSLFACVVARLLVPMVVGLLAKLLPIMLAFCLNAWSLGCMRVWLLVFLLVCLVRRVRCVACLFACLISSCVLFV